MRKDLSADVIRCNIVDALRFSCFLVPRCSALAAGLISISASPHNLGTILSANAIACRMFGYARWQLERRNVSCLVPSPLAESHDHFLKRFLATGEGNVVNYTVSHHHDDESASAGSIVNCMVTVSHTSCRSFNIITTQA